jgi:copper(I)-binding protein
MTPLRFARLACIAITMLGANSVLRADGIKAGALLIEAPWARATPGGAKVAAGYLTITNQGTAPDRLIGATLPQAAMGMVHEMKLENGTMLMREVAGGLEIKPGQKVELKPGGYHVMFMDMTGPLKQGETVKGQLRFEKAGTVEIEYQVQSVGAQGPQGPQQHSH